jgi:hypothetical protein
MIQASLLADPSPTPNSPVEDRGRTDASAWRQPILIGVSGKRKFNKKDAEVDAKVADKIADRFRAIFEALDRELPETPKIVLTGGAFGADLIAAETALQIGRNWAVAVVLPFDRALFEEDFRPSPAEQLEQAWRDRYARHARTFARVLGSSDKPNPRVLVRELPRLSVGGGGVATVDQLSKQSAKYNPTLRHNHYEQVGQFIAETATIMIAVMGGDEQPELSEANGGTARVIASRRAGRPDPVGVEVARRSRVLRQEWPEAEQPPGGFIWLIDPQQADCAGRYPVKALPPLVDRLVEDVYAGHPGQDPAHEPETNVGPGRKASNALCAMAVRLGCYNPEKRAESRRLRASLVVARGFNRYHSEESPTPGPAGAAISPDLTPIANVQIALNAARQRISTRQRKVNSDARRGFITLAILFVLAVSVFEIFTKFFHESAWLLGLYVAVLAVIGIRALRARSMLLEAVAEDYRAVAEMLRVQRAWLAAGLTARVDRVHLQGVDQDLAPIRDCAKTIIAWILLRHGWKDGAPLRDWALVCGAATKPREELRGQKKPPDDWIGSQLWYFIKNGENRETWVQVLDALSWCLFVASGVLAAVLCIWLAFACPLTTTFFERKLHVHLPCWQSQIGSDNYFLPGLLLAVTAIGLRILLHDIHRGRWAIAWTGFFGTLAAAGFALALISAGSLIARATSADVVHSIVSAASIAVIVVLPVFVRWGWWAIVLAGALGALAVFAFAPAPIGAGLPIACATDTHDAVSTGTSAKFAIIAVVVVLSAIAGALRYIMDRLNFEAEALEYRDARGRFQLAERRLARGWDPVTGTPADEEGAKRLVYELGFRALAENESWLKSRRERPLTPVVG